MENKELNNENVQTNNSVQPQQANFSQIFNVESEEQQPQTVVETQEELVDEATESTENGPTYDLPTYEEEDEE